MLCNDDDDEEEEEEGDIDGNFQKWLTLETRNFFHIFSSNIGLSHRLYTSKFTKMTKSTCG